VTREGAWGKKNPRKRKNKEKEQVGAEEPVMEGKGERSFEGDFKGKRRGGGVLKEESGVSGCHEGRFL